MADDADKIRTAFDLAQRKKYLQYADDARSDAAYFQHVGNCQAAERQRDLAAYFDNMANGRQHK